MTASSLHAQLRAENARLKAELAALRAKKEPPIAIDPKAGSVTINRYETDQFAIDRLEFASPAISQTAREMSELDGWIGGQGPKTDLNALMAEAGEVKDLQMRVPFETVNKAVSQIAGPQLEEAGVRNLRLGPGENPNELKLEGRVKKLVEVGFSVTGSMSVSKTGKTRFQIQQSRVAGIPMPNFVTQLATAAFASHDLKEMGVEQEGDSFLVDPQKYLPANIDANLNTVAVTEEGFLLQGGRSGRAGP